MIAELKVSHLEQLNNEIFAYIYVGSSAIAERKNDATNKAFLP